MKKTDELMVEQIARCHARLAKIRKLGSQIARPGDTVRVSPSRLMHQRSRLIHELQQGCPHLLLVEVARNPRYGPSRPIRLCEICGLTESAWYFNHLAHGHIRPGSLSECRRLYQEMLGSPVPAALDEWSPPCAHG